jgi:hypothetical protein
VKRLIVAGAVTVCLFMLTPVLVLILVAGTSASVAACQQWATAQPLAGPSSSHQLPEATLSVRSATSSSLPSGAGQPFQNLTATQTENAGHVFAVGRQLGIPEKGIVTALAVASQESSFRVLANDGRGDDLAPDQQGIEASLRLAHDGVGSSAGSLGIMQQQWPWWSRSMEQLMDPAAASKLFYDALRRVDGWESMTLAEAAQAVQKSAHRAAYGDDEPLAQRLHDHFASGGSSIAADTREDDSTASARLSLTVEEQAECAELLGLPANLSCPPTGLPVEQGLTPDALLVVRCVDQWFGRHTYLGVGERSANPQSDHPAGRAVDVMIDGWQDSNGVDEGTEIAEWIRAHHTELGVKYVIWRARIWSAAHDGEGWRPYTHPSGATDPTSRHMDHVHASVHGNRGTGFPTGGSTVVYPVPAPLADSNRENWGERGSHWSRWHTGTDFSVPCGTPVLAAHAGTIVLDHSQSWAGPTLVKVTLGPGQLTTWYAHMQEFTVREGDAVAAGEQIGDVGSEGNSSGCHLHFEVHLEGGSIYGPDNTDPTPWLAQNVGKTLRGGTARVASFNVLGDSHTRPGGDKPGWPDARTRMRGAVRALNATGVELAGLQEFQPLQERAFLDYTGGLWDTYPHSGGSNGSSANVVAWRTDRWTLVRADRIPIPYFGGQRVRMPYALLRNLATGQHVWLASFHNPADARGPAQHWRDQATRREAALARRLTATGTPVIFTGDMNDRADYFCPTVRTSPLHAANGASSGSGPCRPPANMGIDWIMGSRVRFTGYASDRSVTTRRISDHPLVAATAHLS